MTEQFRPTLLLSMPQLQDPNFARTVVLLCDFVPDGAFGLVINRPTDAAASAMVRLDPPVEHGNDLPLCTGGPVEPDRGWILMGDEPEGVEHRTIVARCVSVHVADSAAPRARSAACPPRARPRRLRGMGTGTAR